MNICFFSSPFSSNSSPYLFIKSIKLIFSFLGTISIILFFLFLFAIFSILFGCMKYLLSTYHKYFLIFKAIKLILFDFFFCFPIILYLDFHSFLFCLLFFFLINSSSEFCFILLFLLVLFYFLNYY